MLRVFLNPFGRHHHISEYRNGHVPPKEVQIYTWLDASLKELSTLMKEINLEARKPGTRFDFALVFPDPNSSNYRIREIGTTINGRRVEDENKTLRQTSFQIGDYLDVAITVPCPGSVERNGSGARSSGNDRRDGVRNFGGGGKFNGDRDRGFNRNRGRPF